jgi:hypothetical protein
MKWINVKDRLPNKDMSVLVYCTGIEIHKWGFQRHKYIDMDFWHNGDKMFCLYKREWGRGCWGLKVRCKSIITDWMPLPKPPKENK